MRARRAANLRLLVGALGALGARPALADRPCPPTAVDADAGVHARWPELPDRIRRAFDQRGDIDACARVALSLREGAIVVEVLLPDGRSASRLVSGRDDVVPTLEALLVVPRHPGPAPALEPPPAPVPVALASGTLDLPEPGSRRASTRDAPARSNASSPSRLRAELSIATDARVGDGQTSLGLGALSFLDISGWLVGFEGRADRYQRTAAGPPAAVLELAALGGRRLRLGTLALDVDLGPALALRGISTTTVVGPQGTSSSSSDGTVPRLLFGARLNVGARSIVRGFVGLDGEVGMTHAPGAELPSVAYRLPIWTAGLALGATVGTP